MDSQRSGEKGDGQSENALQAIDSREGTCVPNSPILAALKPISSPEEGSPTQSVMLEDVEKGQTMESKPPVADSRIRRHFKEDVSAEWADVMLLLCWFTTGFLDSTIFNAYGTFVSMQTGNTVLLGLGASNGNSTNQPYRWAKSLTSLISFIVGCLFFAKASRRLGPSRRSTLTISFLFQSLIIVISAAVVQKGVVEGRIDYIFADIEWMQEIPIVLLSFQAPGQTCGARQLGFFETPTVVVTTMIYDFASDPDLTAPLTKNPVRNRRIAGVLLMLLGAVAGGWVTESMGQIHVTLWVAAAIKAAIGLAWIVWPKKKQDRVWGY